MTPEELSPGAWLLRGAALPFADELAWGIHLVNTLAPFRHFRAKSGRVNAAMTNAGDWGWLASPQGYGYVANDPDTGLPWPAMPEGWADFAGNMAAMAGYKGFVPNGVLLNRYKVGVGLGIHSDKDEEDRVAPIVSVSLGSPATFIWSLARTPVELHSGDVVVFGGPSRMTPHGVKPLAAGERINLTFRKAKKEDGEVL